MLLPDARRARLLLVVGIVGLIPLQFAVIELTGQEPYPGFVLPGFATEHHETTIEVWIPQATVIDSEGTTWSIDPYKDLVGDFPSSPTSALATWFRAGLTGDGSVGPCRTHAHDARPNLLERRCSGYTRAGQVVLRADDLRAYILEQVRQVVPEPKRLVILWTAVRFELGSAVPLGYEDQIRVTIELT